MNTLDFFCDEFAATAAARKRMLRKLAKARAHTAKRGKDVVPFDTLAPRLQANYSAARVNARLGHLARMYVRGRTHLECESLCKRVKLADERETFLRKKAVMIAMAVAALGPEKFRNTTEDAINEWLFH